MVSFINLVISSTSLVSLMIVCHSSGLKLQLTVSCSIRWLVTMVVDESVDTAAW